MEHQQTRAGDTKVTSVSLSKEFRELIDNHNISPTIAMRKGIAVELYDKGLPQYDSPLNRRRIKALRHTLKEKNMELITQEIGNIIEYLQELKKVIDEYK